jgi:chromosome segregation ATPase
MEVRVGPLRDVVDAVRTIVTDWDVFVRHVETLTREHEELRGRCESLEDQLGQLQEAHERVRREHDGTVRALDELRAAHQTLLCEHEEAIRLHDELRERHERLQQDRQHAADGLEGLLRRLKP